MDRFFLFFIFGIVVVAAIPRGIELLNHNYLFLFDQGLFFEAVKNIVVDHNPTLIGSEVGGQGGFFQGPGWYYLLAVPFSLSGGDPYASMIVMFIIGVMTIVTSIFLMRKMFSTVTGLIVGLLIAISPAIVAQSRFIWPPFPISLITVVFIFFLYKVFEKKQKFFPLVTLTIGVMSHFEMATAGIFLIQLFIIVPILYFKKLVSLRYLTLGGISFLLTQITLIIFDLRHQFIISNGILGLVLSKSEVQTDASKHIKSIFLNHIDVFKFNFLSTFGLSDLLWPLLIIFLIAGTISFVKDKKQKTEQKHLVIYLALSPIVFFLVLMLYLKPIWEWWILQLPIFYCFLLGILIVYLWRKAILRPIIVGLVLILVGFFINHSITLYKNDFYDYGGTAKIKGKLAAIDFIYKDAKQKPFGLLVFTPPIYTYAYDYLLWWHAERKYNYKPYSEKKGTFYLLIEPDPQKPWSYKGWLETVVKSGKILNTEELPSGFIVQKRIEE